MASLRKIRSMQKSSKSMLKSIMLTIFTFCVILTTVGCENGNINVNASLSGEFEILYSSGDEEISEERK